MSDRYIIRVAEDDDYGSGAFTVLADTREEAALIAQKRIDDGRYSITYMVTGVVLDEEEGWNFWHDVRVEKVLEPTYKVVYV
jgi:hypothetical protein